MNRIHYNQNVVVLGARRDITQTLTLLAIRQMTMMTRLTFQIYHHVGAVDNGD